MTNTRSSISFLRQTVVRRNVPQRLAGAGYALVTGSWLVATLSHFGPNAVVGESLFAILTLIGLAFAFYRDNVTIDHAAETVQTVRGLPGLTKVTSRSLRDFDRLLVEEEGVEDYPEDAIQPVRRAWFSVYLADSRSSDKLLLLSKPSDETPKARAAGLKKADDQAQRLSLILDLPITH